MIIEVIRHKAFPMIPYRETEKELAKEIVAALFPNRVPLPVRGGFAKSRFANPVDGVDRVWSVRVNPRQFSCKEGEILVNLDITSVGYQWDCRISVYGYPELSPQRSICNFSVGKQFTRYGGRYSKRSLVTVREDYSSFEPDLGERQIIIRARAAEKITDIPRYQITMDGVNIFHDSYWNKGTWGGVSKSFFPEIVSAFDRLGVPYVVTEDGVQLI